MTDSGDSRKLTKVTGDFTITFSGDNASELNGQASNWTRGIIDGDGLMTVKDLGSGFFETYIYLLPDDTEQHIYWELRFQSQSSYSVDLSGFPVIEDTDLGGGLSTFFDFRGANDGNIRANAGSVSIRTAPEPTRSLTVLSEHTVFGNAGTHSLSLGISEDYSFVFEIENPTYERKVDSSDGRKAVYIRGDFDIQFTGAASSELNAQAVFWTRGLIDGDALMRVKDEGSGNFSIYVYLLPDNTELFVYWETRATQSGGFDLDADGYPVISDTTLGNPTSTFFDFRGSNAGNVLASGGAIGIRVVPEPASLRLGVAALSVLLLLASRHGNRQARTNRTV